MIESLEMMSKDLINPALLVTHIGGLNCVPDATLNLPDIPGGKKLIYTHLNMDLVAITDFAEKGRENALFAELDEICKRHNGLWSVEAESHLLAKAEEFGLQV